MRAGELLGDLAALEPPQQLGGDGLRHRHRGDGPHVLVADLQYGRGGELRNCGGHIPKPPAIPIVLVPQKSSSFSQATVREENLGRNLSLGAIKLTEHIERIKKDAEDAAAAAPDKDKDKEPTAGGGEVS